MFGRMDPRFAPEECERLEHYLSERRYLVTRGELGPGDVVPSPAKLQTLIGSTRPLEFDVAFGKNSELKMQLSNTLGFSGTVRLIVDGIYLQLIGKRQDHEGILRAGTNDAVLIPLRRIANVETDANKVRFEYRTPEDDGVNAITLQLLDESRAKALAAILPKLKHQDFTPQLKNNEQFITRVSARSTNRSLLTASSASICWFS